MFIKTSKPL